MKGDLSIAVDELYLWLTGLPHAQCGRMRSSWLLF